MSCAYAAKNPVARFVHADEPLRSLWVSVGFLPSPPNEYAVRTGYEERSATISERRSPLSEARRHGHTQMIDLLREHGASS